MSPLGIESDRATDPRDYRLGSHTPQIALRPATAEEAAEALGVASRDRLKVVVWGGGTRLRRTRPTGGYDVALDLSGVTRILEYEPEDLTLTAECGATLASLRAALAARGQELPLESPEERRATLGGTLAWNGSGPRRLRFGSPADRILGARFALSDGTLARSGGKVVKNVAGFGIHRLLCGSRGGLAVLLTASLKLLPSPERRVALAYGVTRSQVADHARWAGFTRLEPSFLTVLGQAPASALSQSIRSDESYVVVVGLEDDAPWVAEQERRVIAALGHPTARIEGDAVVELARLLADAEHQKGDCLTFTSAHKTPAALAPLLDQSAAERLVYHAPAGRLHWYPEQGDDARHLLPGFLAAGYTAIAGVGALALEAPVAPEMATIALRDRLRLALDPATTLSPIEV